MAASARSRWIGALNAGDLDAMLACLTPEVELHPLRLAGLNREYHERIAPSPTSIAATVVTWSPSGPWTSTASAMWRRSAPSTGWTMARHYLTDPDTLYRLGRP